MPAIETLDREQYAVLWLFVGVDLYDEEQFGLPSLVRVRWIQRQSKVTDKQGNTTQLDGKVITNQTIPLRSAMWLGASANAIREYSAVQNAGSNDRQVMRVETADYTPDIKNRNTRYELGLKRYKDALMPAIPKAPTSLQATIVFAPSAPSNLTAVIR